MSRGSEQTSQLERDEVLSSVDPSPDMVLRDECPGGYVCTDADDESSLYTTDHSEIAILH